MALVTNNIVCTTLLAYQLFAVYICKRRKRFIPCCHDLRLWILLIAMTNGVFVSLSTLRIIDSVVIRGYFVPEILRYLVLFSTCLMFSSAASKNLIQNRKYMHWIVIILFLGSSMLMIHYGFQISHKQRQEPNYNRIVCTDPLLIQIKLPPMLMSLFFCGLVFHLSNILQRLSEEADDALCKNNFEQFAMKRRQRRSQTLVSLQKVVLTFFCVNFYLLGWDLTRYMLNFWKEPEDMNCSKTFESDIANDFLVFLSLFQQTQVEMIVVLVILWKRYRTGPNNESQFDPRDMNTSNYATNMMLRKVTSTEFDVKAFENEMAGCSKMTPEFTQSIGINQEGLQVKSDQNVSYIAKFLDDENDIT
jgi:hypothetical protein